MWRKGSFIKIVYEQIQIKTLWYYFFNYFRDVFQIQNRAVKFPSIWSWSSIHDFFKRGFKTAFFIDDGTRPLFANYKKQSVNVILKKISRFRGSIQLDLENNFFAALEISSQDFDVIKSDM